MKVSFEELEQVTNMKSQKGFVKNHKECLIARLFLLRKCRISKLLENLYKKE